MATSKISDKYQVVIPKEVRERLGWKVGATLHMQPLLDREALLVVSEKKGREPWYDQLRGLGKEAWRGIDPLEYVRGLRAQWDG